MNARVLVMEGSLDEYDIVHVVQTLGAARRASLLELRDEDDELVGSMLFDQGQIASAQADALNGLEAVRRLLKTPRPRRFYVYRASAPAAGAALGQVALVLAQVLSPSVPPPAPEAAEVLFSANLAEINLRDVAAAISLGRVCVGIEVFDSDGQRIGATYLRGGQVLFAAFHKSLGPEALRELLKPRSKGYFVVFRAADAGVGEPIAQLSAVLHAKRPSRAPAAAEPPPRDIDEIEDERTRVRTPEPPRDTDEIEDERTRVRAPEPARDTQEIDDERTRVRAPEPARDTQEIEDERTRVRVPDPPSAAFPREDPRTGTRSIAQRSFPPASAEHSPSGPASSTPSEPRTPSPQPASVSQLEHGRSARATSRGHRRCVVCVTSPRGGAGRTTLSIQLGTALSRRGLQTLLVDADDDGVLGPAADPARYLGVADLLADKANVADTLLPTRVAGLSLLPSGGQFSETFRHGAWTSVLSALGARFDLVLVDCAPRLYGPTLAALAGATHYLMVVAAEPAAAQVCAAFQRRLVEALPRVPELAGVIVNQIDQVTRSSVEGFAHGPLGGAVLNPPIPRSRELLEARAHGLLLGAAGAPVQGAVAWAFDDLASALLERLSFADRGVVEQPLLG